MGRSELHVNIGEVKVGSGDLILRANLGSCVGIGFLWKAQGIFGLAHCFLPITEAPLAAPSARYVNHAVPSLMELMKISVFSKSQIEVVIAGGGEMMASRNLSVPANKVSSVGALNIKAAHRILGEHGFQIAKEFTGGDCGREMQVNCATGEFAIHTLPKLI